MSDYGWNDFWSTSPAESLRNQYRNLMYYLDGEMPTLKNDFSNVETLINDGFKTTVKNPVGSEGVLPELLLESLEITKKEFNSILSSMDTAIDALAKKQATVRDRVDQLNWYCRNEDNREKEYPYSDIHLD